LRLSKLILLIFFAITSLFAFTNVPLEDFYPSAVVRGKKKPASRSEAIAQIQAFYIKRMLTDPIFNKSDIYTDEDDLGFLNLAQHQMMNDMLSQKMAEKLAERDLLKFEERFLKRP